MKQFPFYFPLIRCKGTLRLQWDLQFQISQSILAVPANHILYKDFPRETHTYPQPLEV